MRRLMKNPAFKKRKSRSKKRMKSTAQLLVKGSETSKK